MMEPTRRSNCMPGNSDCVRSLTCARSAGISPSPAPRFHSRVRTSVSIVSIICPAVACPDGVGRGRAGVRNTVLAGRLDRPIGRGGLRPARTPAVPAIARPARRCRPTAWRRLPGWASAASERPRASKAATEVSMGAWWCSLGQLWCGDPGGSSSRGVFGGRLTHWHIRPRHGVANAVSGLRPGWWLPGGGVAEWLKAAVC